MRILKEDTLCIAIDYQEKLIPVIHDYSTVVSNTKKLLEGLKICDVPVMVTQQYTKGLGETVAELKEVLDMPNSITAHEKTSFSAYGEEEIGKLIEQSGKKNIIVCGVESHICVLQTIIDLQNKGYQTILPIDCVGSRTEINKQGAILRAQQEGALITTYEALLFELVQGAGTDSFRAVSKLVK